MNKLTKQNAQKLLKELNADAVIILAFGDLGEVAGASYSKRKKDCDLYGKIMNRIIDVLTTVGFKE